MIEITNPVPVFDKDHNVIAFKYNDGLIIHDCLTNTLNISYLIVSELISNSKTIENVLLDLNEYFGKFSDIKCHDRDFLIDLFKDLVVDENDEMYPHTKNYYNQNNELILFYYTPLLYFSLPSYMGNLVMKKFEYDFYDTWALFNIFLKEWFGLSINRLTFG